MPRRKWTEHDRYCIERAAEAIHDGTTDYVAYLRAYEEINWHSPPYVVRHSLRAVRLRVDMACMRQSLRALLRLVRGD